MQQQERRAHQRMCKTQKKLMLRQDQQEHLARSLHNNLGKRLLSQKRKNVQLGGKYLTKQKHHADITIVCMMTYF